MKLMFVYLIFLLITQLGVYPSIIPEIYNQYSKQLFLFGILGQGVIAIYLIYCVCFKKRNL